ncbi:MAG: hypothetical protein II350_07620 [Clostridia bacterium]|nr:hypothetical protein [Clostridia bacterium]
MKRTLLLLLALLMLLPLAACGNTEPEAPDTPLSSERRVDYEYPDDYLSEEIYPMKKILRDTENYYKAISKAYPDRPVLVLITHKMLSGFSVENNDAINRWLEEKGYGFSLMIYGLPFRREEIVSGLTFEEKLNEYIKAGGRCDLILPDPNWSSLSAHADDTVWDYVEDGLITAISDLATEEQMQALRDVYGETYLEANTDNGKIYGLSPSTLKGAQFQSYIAVSDEVLPLVKGKTVDELGEMLVFDREFLAKAKENAKTSTAVFLLSSSANELIAPFLTKNRYVPLNNLQLYVDAESVPANVLGLWEIPGYEEFVRTHVENIDSGLWTNGGELKTNTAAMIFFSSYRDEKLAKAQLDATLAENEVNRNYTLLSLNEYPVTVGVENAVLISASSENETLSCATAINIATDAELARVLSSGVEGRSYSEENGRYQLLQNTFGVCVLSNPLFAVPATEYLNPLSESCKNAQKNAILSPYENFSPDFTEAESAADALALWGYDLWNYLSVGNAEMFMLSSGVDAASFLEISPPDISALKESLADQLEYYTGRYLEPRE